MKSRCKKRKESCHLLSPGYLKPYLGDFINELSENGYSQLTINAYYSSVAHFSTWLQKKNVLLTDVNEKIITKFSKHRCQCSGARNNHNLSLKYMARVQRFALYLRQQGIISFELNLCKIQPLLHIENFKELLQSRGLASKTIIQYEYSIYRLLPLLGRNPKKYNAVNIRQVICNIAKQESRCAVKKTTTALRAYLRFLTTEGACRPDLDTAVPSIAEWKLSSLPKYITTNELAHVIDACNPHTQQGIRDRAIILLLGHLGLRAGDVSNMQVNDIDWLEGTLRVSGKGRREVLLPLPQNIGDAILNYIETVRPQVAIDKLFLCLNAPYRSFPSSSGISSIVNAALTRAGITHAPSRGANLLRHTAATNMLRNGATLDAVSAVLRHRSLDMTAYYAKVDIPRLLQIAQPWPEGAPC